MCRTIEQRNKENKQFVLVYTLIVPVLLCVFNRTFIFSLIFKNDSFLVFLIVLLMHLSFLNIVRLLTSVTDKVLSTLTFYVFEFDAIHYEDYNNSKHSFIGVRLCLLT